MIEERIKLAEAMGIDPHGDGMVFGKRWAFDPFADANDDYAVLEWMRERGIEAWQIVEECEYCIHYKIGDYARAALKVIE